MPLLSKHKYDLVLGFATEGAWVELVVPRGVADPETLKDAENLLKRYCERQQPAQPAQETEP